jgi:hypothetical protein
MNGTDHEEGSMNVDTPHPGSIVRITAAATVADSDDTPGDNLHDCLRRAQCCRLHARISHNSLPAIVLRHEPAKQAHGCIS